mmetsp:Transcript_2288/g.4961  ORF Transcript_2288/g.4961 Transcript_2288/m.4961 type:complete len:224 (+) Transcript_2288:491-1162(+)
MAKKGRFAFEGTTTTKQMTISISGWTCRPSTGSSTDPAASRCRTKTGRSLSSTSESPAGRPSLSSCETVACPPRTGRRATPPTGGGGSRARQRRPSPPSGYDSTSTRRTSTRGGWRSITRASRASWSSPAIRWSASCRRSCRGTLSTSTRCGLETSVCEGRRRPWGRSRLRGPSPCTALGGTRRQIKFTDRPISDATPASRSLPSAPAWTDGTPRPTGYSILT